MEKKLSRRSLMKLGLLGLGFFSVLKRGGQGLIHSAMAAACPPARPKSVPAAKFAEPDKAPAKAQDYVEDATKSKNAAYKAGQTCENCQFYKPDKAEGGYAPCLMLGLKYVSNCGWCKLYKEKKKA